MNKKEIQKEYNKKIKLYNSYSKHYYDNSSPIVSDRKFDELKHVILLLEKNYNFLNSKKSPSQMVGFKPSKNFNKVKHRIPMLSLSNAFDEKDLLNFEKKILNFISKEDGFKILYSAEPKIDGISASLTPIKTGELIKGLSRGDGKEGEEIPEN
jgi:DNA ligase (NAD+)